MIPSYPLSNRDASRLLYYNRGEIVDKNFKDLPALIPSGAMMIFNNSRVVPARLFFNRESGAIIEIFCLEPIDPADYTLSFASTSSVIWRVIVGNKKRWKGDKISMYNPQKNNLISNIQLSAQYVKDEGDTCIVCFQWHNNLSFAEVLDICGQIPIPPYLHRESEIIDIERYQTIYANLRGSVAAPTAGLHFSPKVISSLKDKGIKLSEITLHVGAGTFKPVKEEMVMHHAMHHESFTVSLSFLEQLLVHKGEVICVGTTSVRCVESLYYFGLMCCLGREPKQLSQWEAYRDALPVTREESLEQLITYLKKQQCNTFSAKTQIMIVPSFVFRWTSGMITNFHQPKSTLLLLIAAFMGDEWKRCYHHALQHGYRFLSYGDSSLLCPSA